MRILFPSTGWKGSIRPYTSSFSWNDEIVLNVDFEGRWLSVIFDKTTYRRALNGQWMSIKRESNKSPRNRKFLDLDAIISLYSKISESVFDLEKASNKVDFNVDFEDKDPFIGSNPLFLFKKWIRIMKIFNPELEQEENAKYNQIYSKVGILPPDRYGSLVLQATIGCVYNKCSFCNFYRNIGFHRNSPAEFQSHINEVKQFVGQSLGRFHSIFLGDANALFIPHEQLIEIFDLLNKEFDISNQNFSSSLIFKDKPLFSGVYSFLDVFSGHNKSFSEFKQLYERGLKSVYLGIESGSVELLNFLRKPNKLEDIIILVENLHKAKIGVVTIFLIGAGGKKYEKNHISDSLNLIKKLNLTKNDLIYFSKLIPPPNTEYSILMQDEGGTALNNEELEKQIHEFKKKINDLYFNNLNKPKIAKYEIRDFLY